LTDETGTYKTEFIFSLSGLYYVRATSSELVSSCEHVVADFFVAGDGSGDFVNIQTAIDALPLNGGVVYVKLGVYELNPELKYPYKSIVLRSNLTLIGGGVDQTIIRVFPNKQPVNSDVRVDGITSMDDIENLIIENLTLVQNGTPDNNGSSALYLRYGNHKNITIRNVKVTDAYGAGIAIPRATNVLIENCTVDRIWTGITIFECTNVQIRYNKVTNTRGDGIFPQRTNKDVIIEYNYIENVGDTGIDITASKDYPPHERIVARNNTLKNASVRISQAINIQFANNTIENGWVCIDAGQGRPINVTVEGNKVTSPYEAGIAFEGARDSVARNNKVEMLTPAEGVVQSGITAAIWGTGIIENNTIVNAANYGISFANWGLGEGSNITIRGNTILGFQDIGIYDDGKHQGGIILIEDNVIKDGSEPFVSRYGIRTGYEENKWIIRKNRIYAGKLGFISAPNSDVYENIYGP
jgi:hypothetical protein